MLLQGIKVCKIGASSMRNTKIFKQQKLNKEVKYGI